VLTRVLKTPEPLSAVPGSQKGGESIKRAKKRKKKRKELTVMR